LIERKKMRESPAACFTSWQLMVGTVSPLSGLWLIATAFCTSSLATTRAE
jgi:hypothetical protein